jgi:hypothetical protein
MTNLTLMGLFVNISSLEDGFSLREDQVVERNKRLKRSIGTMLLCQL